MRCLIYPLVRNVKRDRGNLLLLKYLSILTTVYCLNVSYILFLILTTLKERIIEGVSALIIRIELTP